MLPLETAVVSYPGFQMDSYGTSRIDGVRGSSAEISRDGNNVPSVGFKGSNSPVNATHAVNNDGVTAPKTRLLSVAVLCFVNLINYMDRFTVAGVLIDVKKFYSISDTEGGLLQTVFVCSYMLLAPLFGYLGDRYSRKAIIVFGIVFWSGTTLAGSFIPRNHFWAFMLLRGTVGIGEASYSTLAPTIISDLYVGKRRSLMLAVFYFAIPVGSGLGYIVGSNVASAFGQWQYCLRVTPLLGIIAVLLLIFVLKEPPHGEAEGGQHLSATDWRTDLKCLIKNKSFVWSTLGFTCVAFVIGSLAWWAPLFMTLGYRVRGYHTSEARIDLIFGVITCFAGLFGVALGSAISTTMKKKYLNADALVCGAGMLIGTPFLFVSAILANKNLIASWSLIFIGEVLFCMNWPLVADILLYVVVPTRRGIAEAVQMVVSHALGDAISPYIIGTLSDSIKSGKIETDLVNFQALQYALFATTFVAIIGGVFFLFAALYLVKDKEEADRLTRGNDYVDSIGEDLIPVVMSADDVEPLIT